MTDIIAVSYTHLDVYKRQVNVLNNYSNRIIHGLNNFLYVYCRQLPSLVGLETLHMRDTQRTLANMPPSLESLTNLTDLDLSYNNLPKVPDALYTLPGLKRLNLSNNSITELSLALGKSLFCHSV